MDKPKILSEEEIKRELEAVPGWEYENGRISKEFKFADFMGVFNFISKLAPFFEEIDHHPDMHIFYNKIKFELLRYDVGEKVTDRDFTVAKKIESEYRKI